MKIILDIYGGDNDPLAPLKGAEMDVNYSYVDGVCKINGV